MAAFRSLSRAMFRGFVRDRTALVFSILIPVLFLVLFGSIYKSTSAPKVSVIEVGRVPLLDQAVAGSHGQLGKVMTITRGGSLAAALEDHRKAPTTPPCSSRAAAWSCTTRSPIRSPRAWSRPRSRRSCSRPTWRRPGGPPPTS